MARCTTSMLLRLMRSRRIGKFGSSIRAATCSPSSESQIWTNESSSHGKGVGDGLAPAGDSCGEDGGFAAGGGVFGVGAEYKEGVCQAEGWGAGGAVQCLAEKGGRGFAVVAV